ncbi:MAG: InlB B-repeat-containing protein [Dysosmobacter sp.]
MGDTLLQPAVPTAPEGQAFAGWYTADGKKFEDFGEVQAVSGNVNLYARFETAYYVFYLDREGKIIATQEYVDGDSVRTDEVLLSVGVDEALVGWSVEDDGTADEDLRINGANMTLYPVVKDAHWITFHSNGGSVVESMYVVTGGVTVEPEEPERTGYWFDGWYQNEELTEAFTFGSQLTENIDLYAKWTASQAQYKVVYWQENADDDGYTYTEMQVKTGTVGEEATYDRKNYTGFTLNTEKTEEAATTIAGDGTTVRNVYYERQRYTLTFQVYKSSGWYGGSWETVYSQDGIKYGAKTNTWWQEASNQNPDYLWYTSKNGSTFYTAEPTMPNNNLTVYGKEGRGSSVIYYYEKGTDNQIHEPFYVNTSGWSFTEEDYIQIPGFTHDSQSKRNNTYYIYYTRNSYDIDFNTNGGPSVSSVTNIPYEADISNRAPSSYQVGQTTKNVNGQTWYFAGWYDNEALAGEPYSFSGKTMPAHDLILYASWTTKTYTVTFDYNDGTGYKTQIDNVPYGSTVAEPEEPTREGYLFAGWTKDGAPFHFTTPISGNTTLVANWISSEGYTVRYDSNGGSAVSDPLVYAAGAKAEVQAQPATGPVNKLFLGWKSSADGKIYYPGDSITVPEGGVTLTAQWGDPQSTTKVIYNANGGTIKGGTTFTDTGLVINGVYTVIAEKPTRTNYTFLGWLLADGKTLVQPGDKIQVDADGGDAANTLTAQWKQSAYNVTYKLDGQIYDVDDVFDGSKNAGSTVTVAPKAEKPGYTVTDWTSEDVTISGGSFTMPDHDVILTATSKINTHDIIYKVDGVEVETFEDVPYGTELTEAQYGHTYTAPEGYTFSGWNKDLPASMPDADVVIEGTTIINKHTITYEIVGEYFTDPDYKVIENVAYGTKLSLIPDDMTKTGYSFSGWSGLPETMPDHDVTVTGSYTLNQYTITYWVDGKQVQQYTKVNYGTDLTSGYDYEPTPEQIPADKVFVGWMETLPDTMPATNLDLHAQLRDLFTADLTIRYVLKGTSTPIRADKTVTLTENAAAVNVKDLVYQTLSKDDVEGYYVYDSDTADGNYSYQYGDERNHVLTVYYTEQTYTVEASIVAENADNEPGGTITPTRETVNKGGDQAVTWTIDEGYEIVKVEVDGSVVSLDKNSYDFTNISANHTVKVTTRPIEYSVVFQRGESGKLEGSDYENSDWFWRLVDTVKSWILGEDQVASMNQYTYKFTIEDLNDGAALSAADIEARIFEKCGIGRDEGEETAGKPLKYAGNGDFRRGTEARIINNLEMRMRRRRSALFSRPRGHTTAAARRGAHIRRIQKSPGNAHITAFLRLLDGMSRSAPSRKSQQQTKRTRASRLILLL